MRFVGMPQRRHRRASRSLASASKDTGDHAGCTLPRRAVPGSIIPRGRPRLGKLQFDCKARGRSCLSEWAWRLHTGLVMGTVQLAAPIRRHPVSLWLQLFFFAAATACLLPYLGSNLASFGDAGGPLFWFGWPALALLAGNAAWRLHNAGRATAPLAGLGVIAGSGLTLPADWRHRWTGS